MFLWNFDILSVIFCGEWFTLEVFFGKKALLTRPWMTRGLKCVEIGKQEEPPDKSDKSGQTKRIERLGMAFTLNFRINQC